MKNKIKIIIMILFTILFLSARTTVKAQEVTDVYGDVFEMLDFTDVNSVLSEDTDINFSDIVIDLLNNSANNYFMTFLTILKDKISSQISYNRNVLISIITISVIAAVFTNFSSVFAKGKISDTAFYISYIVLILLLLASFKSMCDEVSVLGGRLVDFMNALIPAYFMSVAFAKGGHMAFCYYEFTLIVIWLAEVVITKIVMNGVSIYVVLNFINNLNEDELLGKFVELLKNSILWSLKIITGAVLGLNVIQGLVTPWSDTFKRNLAKNLINVIPGVGDVFNSFTDVIIGSGTAIKNGIGAAALVMIIVISIVPVIKAAVFTFMYMLVAALIEPVSDRRIVDAVSRTGEGALLLLKSVMTCIIIFFITIAIICVSTNQG